MVRVIIFIFKASRNKVEGFQQGFVSLTSIVGAIRTLFKGLVFPNFRYDKIVQLRCFMLLMGNGKHISSNYSEGSVCSPSVRVSICLSVRTSVCLSLRPSVHSFVRLSVSQSIGSVNKSGTKDIYIGLKRMYNVIYSKERKFLIDVKLFKLIFNKFKFIDKSVSSLSTKLNSL